MIGLIAVLLLAVAMGVISRWHGGGFFTGVPKLLRAVVWSIPLAGVVMLAAARHSGAVGVWVAGGLALVWSVLMKETGHGGGYDLAHDLKEPFVGRDPEMLEHLILCLHGRLPRYWYDFLMMAIIGLFSTAGAAALVGWYGAWSAAIVLVVGGMMKAPAYAIGWVLWDRGLLARLPRWINFPTSVGEVLTGAAVGAAIGVAALLI